MIRPLFAEKACRARPFLSKTAQSIKNINRTISPFYFVLYLVLPSFVWSLVYREPKVVVDVIPLMLVEAMLPSLMSRLLRIFWCVVCVMMLLLEWNIFPESYFFYLTLTAKAASFPQGKAVLAGCALLALFVALPSPRAPRKVSAIALAFLYIALTLAKTFPVTKPHLLWLRQPAPRAAQVLWTDGTRLLNASVAPGTYIATSGGNTELRRLLNKKQPQKVLIIILESWGETPEQLAQLLPKLSKAAGPSAVHSGYAHYNGPTLSGEIRELCGKVLSFRSVESSLANCLPQQAKHLNYTTTAFHGYEGFFYNRQIIYPQLGFDKSVFGTDLKEEDRCGGAFNGICDDAVLNHARAQLLIPGKQFVYIMSLSAHEPVDNSLYRRKYIENYISQQPASLNSRIANEALLLSAISEARKIAKRDGMIMYVAGDHNPPGQEEALGLPQGEVPYVIINWIGDR